MSVNGNSLLIKLLNVEMYHLNSCENSTPAPYPLRTCTIYYFVDFVSFINI